IRRSPPPSRAAARFSSRRWRMSFIARSLSQPSFPRKRESGRNDPRFRGVTRRGSAGKMQRYRSTSEDQMAQGSELYRKGMEKRRQLMGDAAVEASAKGVYADPVMQKFLDVAIENVFGALWTRPGLDDKTRALICVISDTCTGREPELA